MYEYNFELANFLINFFLFLTRICVLEFFLPILWAKIALEFRINTLSLLINLNLIIWNELQKCILFSLLQSQSAKRWCVSRKCSKIVLFYVAIFGYSSEILYLLPMFSNMSIMFFLFFCNMFTTPCANMLIINESRFRGG